ncbi:MAG: hypothetical protein P1V20_30150 [Verrucomicrobiales bacterium]|nr:hypothetical protein [Verrucomicrobiales bacterium]
MKRLFFIAILFGPSLLLHAAEPFVPPQFVKELKDLQSVKSLAARDNKAVSFLLMEPGST